MWGISITIHRNNFLQDSIYPEITYHDAMMLRIRLLPGGFIRILLFEKRTKALTLTFFFVTIYRSFDAVCYEIKGMIFEPTSCLLYWTIMSRAGMGFLTFSLWTKSCSDSDYKMNPLWNYVHMVLLLFMHFTRRNLEILLNLTLVNFGR